ncbi:hypothetical protein A3Q56_02467 [Intoshia linei]|uniref:protein kinase C n=1 Tax=Intoshia linei TaxID=1819745 RepID=A0A177B663_9BILA|nr:hypothetical protein A3Q56_02467 [Intoshia linei]
MDNYKLAPLDEKSYNSYLLLKKCEVNEYNSRKNFLISKESLIDLFTNIFNFLKSDGFYGKEFLENYIDIYESFSKFSISLSDFVKVNTICKKKTTQIDLVKDPSDTIYVMKTIICDHLNISQVLHTSRDNVLNDGVFSNKCYNEIKILAKTENHFFLPILYYSFFYQKQAHLIMEYCIGGNLENFIIKNPIIKFENLLFYVDSMGKCIDGLHQLGFIHGNIIPENFLISSTGHFKICNFEHSICKNENRLDREHLMIENIFYMSLNYYNNGKPNLPTVESDFYAYGVCLYRIMYGKPTRRILSVKDINHRIEFDDTDYKSLIHQLLFTNDANILNFHKILLHDFFLNQNIKNCFNIQDIKENLQENSHVDNIYSSWRELNKDVLNFVNFNLIGFSFNRFFRKCLERNLNCEKLQISDTNIEDEKNNERGILIQKLEFELNLYKNQLNKLVTENESLNQKINVYIVDNEYLNRVLKKQLTKLEQFDQELKDRDVDIQSVTENNNSLFINKLINSTEHYTLLLFGATNELVMPHESINNAFETKIEKLLTEMDEIKTDNSNLKSEISYYADSKNNEVDQIKCVLNEKILKIALQKKKILTLTETIDNNNVESLKKEVRSYKKEADQQRLIVLELRCDLDEKKLLNKKIQNSESMRLESIQNEYTIEIESLKNKYKDEINIVNKKLQDSEEKNLDREKMMTKIKRQLTMINEQEYQLSEYESKMLEFSAKIKKFEEKEKYLKIESGKDECTIKDQTKVISAQKSKIKLFEKKLNNFQKVEDELNCSKKRLEKLTNYSKFLNNKQEILSKENELLQLNLENSKKLIYENVKKIQNLNDDNTNYKIQLNNVILNNHTLKKDNVNLKLNLQNFKEESTLLKKDILNVKNKLELVKLANEEEQIKLKTVGQQHIKLIDFLHEKIDSKPKRNILAFFSKKIVLKKMDTVRSLELKLQKKNLEIEKLKKKLSIKDKYLSENSQSVNKQIENCEVFEKPDCHNDHVIERGLNCKTQTCMNCMKPVYFVNNAAKCLECGIVIHVDCVDQLRTKCNGEIVNSDFMVNFDKSIKVDQCKNFSRQISCRIKRNESFIECMVNLSFYEMMLYELRKGQLTQKCLKTFDLTHVAKIIYYYTCVGKDYDKKIYVVIKCIDQFTILPLTGEYPTIVLNFQSLEQSFQLMSPLCTVLLNQKISSDCIVKSFENTCLTCCTLLPQNYMAIGGDNNLFLYCTQNKNLFAVDSFESIHEIKFDAHFSLLIIVAGVKRIIYVIKFADVASISKKESNKHCSIVRLPFKEFDSSVVTMEFGFHSHEKCLYLFVETTESLHLYLLDSKKIQFKLIQSFESKHVSRFIIFDKNNDTFLNCCDNNLVTYDCGSASYVGQTHFFNFATAEIEKPYMNGNTIQTMALKIGKRLKKPNFRASNEHTFYQIVINLVENNGNVTDEFRAYDENDYSDDEFIDSLIPLIEEDTNHKDSIDKFSLLTKSPLLFVHIFYEAKCTLLCTDVNISVLKNNEITSNFSLVCPNPVTIRNV